MLKIRWQQAYFVLAATLFVVSPALARESNEDSDRASDQRQSSSDNRESSDDDDHAHHQGALGVSIDDSDGTARVTAVVPGSPAAKAGIRVGDEIRSVDDERIKTADGLIDEIGDKQPGATVEISLRRNGDRRTVEARLASHESTFGRRNRWSNQSSSHSRYDASNDDDSGYHRELWQQLRQLQRQVSYLQQEVDQLCGQDRTYQSRGYQSNRYQDGRRYSAGVRGARLEANSNGRGAREARNHESRDDDHDFDDTDND